MTREDQIRWLVSGPNPDPVENMRWLIERGAIADKRDVKIIRRMFLDATEPKEKAA